jgi:Tfp pilus assembly PilM family ATPase
METTLSPNQRLLELIRKPAAAGAAKALDVTRKAAFRPKPGLLSRLLPQSQSVSVGVDISQTVLACVKIRGRDAGYELLGTVLAVIPDGVAPGSAEFVALLRRTLSDLCGQGAVPHIWAAAQSSRANVQFVTIPKVSSRQVDNAVYWTAKKEMAFEEGSVVFDFERRGEVTEKGAPKIGALAYTAPRDAVEVVRGDFARAGFPLTGLTLEPFAHQNIFRRKLVPGAGATTANLHVGQNWSRLEIFSGGNLMFVRVIKTSMSGMVQSVQESLEAHLRSSSQAARQAPPAEAGGAGPEEPGLSLSPEMADRPLFDLDAQEPEGGGLVLELDAEPIAPLDEPEAPGPEVTAQQAREVFDGVVYGCERLEDCHPGAGLGPDDVMAMLEPVASRLVRQVEMTLKHYRETLGYEAVTGITVSGFLGASPLFLRYIGEQTGLACDPLDPLAGREASAGEVNGSQWSDPAWSQALGLALSDAAITPNMLCTYLAKAAKQTSRLLEQWSLVGLAAVLAAMAFFSFDASSKLRALTREREALHHEMTVLGATADIANLSRISAELQTKRNYIRSYIIRNRAAGIIDQALALAPDGVTLGTITYEDGPPLAVAKKPQPGQPAQDASAQKRSDNVSRVVLEGMVSGEARLFDSMLASYVVALEGSPLIEDVSVKKSDLEAMDGGATGLHFVLGLTLSGDKP